MSDTSGYWGDLADEAAEKLRQEHLAEIEEGTREVTDDISQLEGLDRRSLFVKLEFKWKQSDSLVLERIRAACQQVTSDEYRVLASTLDDLHYQVRVPVLNPQGFPVKDEKGRVVWQKDERGQYVEDWKSLDGLDLEVAIYKLQKSRVEMSTRVNELLQEAIFAKHIYNDTYYDGYKSLIDGTQGDRTAQAHRVTREEKYVAFYKFCLWQSADTLLKEIKGLQRVLERIRDWRVRTTPR